MVCLNQEVKLFETPEDLKMIIWSHLEQNDIWRTVSTSISHAMSHQNKLEVGNL